MEGKNCSCIRDNEYFFSIDHRDDHILYTDYSNWIVPQAQGVMSQYSVTITNGDESKVFTVRTSVSTVIPYKDLPTNCEAPCNFDGVYTFSIKVCQGSQEFQRTEAILKSVINVYDQLIYEKRDEDAFEVLLYIEKVKSFSRNNLLVEAAEAYASLIKIIKRLNCNCNGF